MQPLDKALRNKLERTIKEAREAAEAAARAALEHPVYLPRFCGHEQRSLREK